MRFRAKFIMMGLCIVMLTSGCGNQGTTIVGEDQEDNKVGVFEAGDSETKPEENGQEEFKENEIRDQQEETENLDEILLRYREERQNSNQTMSDGTVLVVEPSQIEYDIDFSGYEYMNSLFDTREKTEAFDAALNYLKATYGIEKVNSCVDPRIYELYGSEDKGVANGYEDSNIFVAEYCNSGGEWNYLILVREGKGSEWKVVGDGKDYKE